MSAAWKKKDLPPPLGNADIKSNKMKNSNNDSSKLSMIYSTFAIGDVDANFQAWRLVEPKLEKKARILCKTSSGQAFKSTRP